MSTTPAPSFWSQAALVFRKDLEIEARTRAATARVLPFAAIMLVLFAIALDPDRGLLPRVAPGLFWITALLAALMSLGRSAAVERENRAGLSLLASGLDPGAMFVGKSGAVWVQLLALEALVGIGMAALYGIETLDAPTAIAASVLASAAVACAGTLYAAMASGDRSRESLLAVLLLPVLVPVLIAGTRVIESATTGSPADAAWLGLLGAFTALYGGAGVLAFGSLLEEV